MFQAKTKENEEDKEDKENEEDKESKQQEAEAEQSDYMNMPTVCKKAARARGNYTATRPVSEHSLKLLEMVWKRLLVAVTPIESHPNLTRYACCADRTSSI